MKRCKTCKFWAPLSDANSYLEKEHMAECVQPLIAEEDQYSDEQGNRKDMLLYQYNEGGSFMTGYNFGCVHHEEKQ